MDQFDQFMQNEVGGIDAYMNEYRNQCTGKMESEDTSFTKLCALFDKCDTVHSLLPIYLFYGKKNTFNYYILLDSMRTIMRQNKRLGNIIITARMLK